MCNVLQLPADVYKLSNKNKFFWKCIRKTSTLALAPGYQPQEVENGKWEKLSMLIGSENHNLQRGNFRMLLPPPNVTGNLHLGHALMAVIQDVICRQKRQSGFETSWVPGTDHAGIATQVVVEKMLYKERGLSRHQVGRHEFMGEIKKWQLKNQAFIKEDLNRLGCTLNWDREYFTMDKSRSYAVNEAFIQFFEEGLIKRQKSLVNWSCTLQSAISDIEVEFMDVKKPTQVPVPGYDKSITFGRIYDIDYKVLDGNANEYVTVSTTRPETMLGDVAVAVHPNDERYRKYRHLPEVHLWHPLRQEPIPLIFDIEVDATFGTGAVKITPAHDRQDFHIAQKHHLTALPVINEFGVIADGYGEFSGKPRFQAREKILQRLGELNLLRAVKDHIMQLPLCSRSKDILEYMLIDQWFLNCQEMAKAALSEVLSGRLQIIPSSHEVEWQRWLENCHDWCISRQLWWGHQIPAYKASASDTHIWVAAHTHAEALAKASKILKTSEIMLERDNDVLDTWFSSAVLPFSTASWPSLTYKDAYPLDLMVTGHDILFFWVARMVMMGLKLTNQLPFKKILLTGIVCDAHGRKMSKSLGNIIRPQQVIQGSTLEVLQQDIKSSHEKGILSKEEMEISLKGVQRMFPQGIPLCGTDALRFTLCSHNIKNHFINFDISECRTNKLFFNKIWQATQFTLNAAKLLEMPLHEVESINNDVPLSKWDKWILSRLCDTLQTVQKSFDQYDLHAATSAFKQFLYKNLCDVYLETTKRDIYAKSANGFVHCATLTACLSWSLQAMSPFTPFLSAELLKHLPRDIVLNLTRMRDTGLEEDIEEILNICQSIRQLKSCNGITRKHEPQLNLYAHTLEALQLLQTHLPQIQTLTQTQAAHLLMLSPNTEVPKAEEGENVKFTFTSTAGPKCTFSRIFKKFQSTLYPPHNMEGVITNDSYTKQCDKILANKDINRQKLEKLEKDLERYLQRWQNEGFQKSTSTEVQQKHMEKMQRLKVEIEKIKSIAG